jgi:hypothetical protein
LTESARQYIAEAAREKDESVVNGRIHRRDEMHAPPIERKLSARFLNTNYASAASAVIFGRVSAVYQIRARAEGRMEGLPPSAARPSRSSPAVFCVALV